MILLMLNLWRAGGGSTPVLLVLRPSRGALVAPGMGEVELDIEEAEGAEAVRLIERIRNGDHDAESELVRRFSNAVRFLLEHRTRDRDLAADLHQDAFQIILTKARDGEIKQPERLPSFVRGVAVNVLMSWRRHLRRHPQKNDEELIAGVASESRGPFGALEVQDRCDFVRQVLGELNTDRDRRILSRFYLDDADKTEICEELDVSSDHFDRVLYRAKHRFKQIVLMRAKDGDT